MPPNKLEEEVRILREAVKRFEGMEVFDTNPKGFPTAIAIRLEAGNVTNEAWRTQRNAVSVWVKEQLGEV